MKKPKRNSKRKDLTELIMNTPHVYIPMLRIAIKGLMDAIPQSVRDKIVIDVRLKDSEGEGVSDVA